MDLFLEKPHPCPYIPDKTCQNVVFQGGPFNDKITEGLLAIGFRHFGTQWFTPGCKECDLCRSITIDVNRFTPSKSQRKLLRKNSDLSITVHTPSISDEKLDLINRYHLSQSDSVGWSEQEYDDYDYHAAFIDQNVWCREYQIHLDEQLIAVGYFDTTPSRASSIYFYYDPDFRNRSLGTWSILQELLFCQENTIPILHLGLWNELTPSLSYKSRFSPHTLREKRSFDEIVEELKELFQ